jgi:preprotein translocase subunit SecF
MWIIKNRSIFYTLSVILIVGSIITFFVPGIRAGIDFTGGSLAVFHFDSRPELEVFTEGFSTVAEEEGVEDYTIQPTGDEAYTVRTEPITEIQKDGLAEGVVATFSENNPSLEQFTNIGPTVGNELKSKAYLAIAIVLIAIVLFITFAFREVSKPVVSWKYGLATVVALAHDIIIPTGAYILYSKFFGGELDMLFISALLAILGFSVHDTIVVFDRIRENLRINAAASKKEDFENTVGRSVEQTFTRSINTSVTVFIVLLALMIFGSDVIKPFAFTLLAGIVVGTYSSIFIASPLMVTLFKRQAKN